MKKINYLEPAKSRRSNLKRLTWGNIYVLQNQTIKFCRKLYHAAKQLLASRPKQIFGGFSNQQTIILATAAHIHQTPMLIVVYALALTYPITHIPHEKQQKPPTTPNYQANYVLWEQLEGKLLYQGWHAQNKHKLGLPSQIWLFN